MAIMDATTHARTRWFHLTPGRFVVGLLAVEFLLFLSQWFRWLPKGWPVLIAIATVGLAVLGMFVWFGAALVFRRRFQFSLRSLFVLVVAVAMPCSWFAVEMKRAREQRDVVDSITKLGASVQYDWQFDATGSFLPNSQPSVPVWLRKLLGEDCFGEVYRVRLRNTTTTDTALEQIKGFTQLQELRLSSSNVTDNGLKHIEGLTQLKELWLGDTKVTDAGLVHLKGLTQLRELWLYGTNVTDVGMEHLKHLTKLQSLALNRTRVTDAGLVHLESLTDLWFLDLDQSRITNDGTKKLQQALPKCGIRY